MNSKAKEGLKSIGVLCLIAAVSGLLLGFMNRLTYVDPLKEAMGKFAELYGKEISFELKAENQGNVVYMAVGNEDGEEVYAILSEGKGGYKGTVQMYVFIKGNEIVSLYSGENSETFMNKLQDANFYDNFTGRDLDEVRKFKPDAVSSATKSSNAVTDAVNNAVDFYKAYKITEGEENE